MLFKPLKPLKDAKEFKEEEKSAITLKFPPIVSRFSKPSKDAKKFEEEDSAITLKSPPIVSRFRNPSKEVIPPALIIRLSVIVFKPYKPSKVVKVEHSNLSEPLISVSRLFNFCKVVIFCPLTITFPLTLV